MSESQRINYWRKWRQILKSRTGYTHYFRKRLKWKCGRFRSKICIWQENPVCRYWKNWRLIQSEHWRRQIPIWSHFIWKVMDGCCGSLPTESVRRPFSLSRKKRKGSGIPQRLGKMHGQWRKFVRCLKNWLKASEDVWKKPGKRQEW